MKLRNLIYDFFKENENEKEIKSIEKKIDEKRKINDENIKNNYSMIKIRTRYNYFYTWINIINKNSYNQLFLYLNKYNNKNSYNQLFLYLNKYNNKNSYNQLFLYLNKYNK